MSSIINARHRTDDRHELPGPRGLPLVGSLPALLREGPFEFVERCWRAHGDMFQIPTLGHQRIVVVTHPDEIDRVLTRTDIYVKDRNYDPVRPLLGDGLITSSGDLWLSQRKLIQPIFHRTMLRNHVPTMARCVDEMLLRWDRACAAGQTIDIYAEMARLTHHIVGLTLFGLDLMGSAEDAARAVADSVHLAGERVNRGALVLPLWIPTASNRQFRRGVQTLDGLVYGIIDRARRTPVDPEAPRTLLRLLLDTRDESGACMSDRQLRDELLTQYIAGQETTALALTWALYQLAGRTDMTARIRSEAGQLAVSPSLEDYDALAYTRMVVDESMRLRPPVWALTRMASRHDRLRGHPIEAGTTVMFGIYFAHRHPDFWDEPEVFRPERFTPERIKARHRHAYIPFIAGPRTCVGKRFAIYEAVISLSAILRRYDVDVLPGQEVGMKVGATCHPDRPILARLVPAAGA